MAGDEASTTAPRSLTTPAAVAYRAGSARAPPRGGGLPLCWLALAAAAALLAALPALFSVRYRTYAVTTGSGAIVVTGASSGIGAHAAEALARKGWIVFASVRSEAGAAAVRALGVPTLLPLLLDVTQAASRAAALAAVEAELAARGGMALVALVNNAGISRSGLPLEVEPEALTREVFETNVFGALATTQTFLPLLRAAQGRIVMVSSVAGVLGGVPTMGAYAASKHALEALSDALRRELAPAGVSVSVVEPAFVRTSIAANNARSMSAGSSDAAAALAAAYERAAVAYPWIIAPGGKPRRGEEDVDRGDDPQVTTDAIAHAVENERPRTRYVVASVFLGGRVRTPAVVATWLDWLLSDRMMDALLGSAYKRSE